MFQRSSHFALLVRLMAFPGVLISLATLNAAPVDVQPPQASPAASSAAVPPFRQANKVAVLRIEDEVTPMTLKSLERRVREAKAGGAEAIVFDINTPGGDLKTTLDICHLIRTEAPANTVAWVNPQAYSAGTIIALACREIVVAPNSTFGDAAPIQAPLGMLIEMSPTERAKIEAPLRSQVIDSARRNHYDENLVQAFVRVGVELWMLENKQTGERIFVDKAEYERVFGEAPTVTQPPAIPKPAGDGPAVPPVRPQITDWIEEAAQDVTAIDEETLREQIEQEIEFEQQLPARRQPLTAEQRDDWTVVGQVVAADELLTVKPAEAIHYGLAKRIIANDQELKQFFGAQTLVRYDRSWSESLVRFLVSFPVRGVLIVIFLLALFIELAVPGFGVFGATAFGALALLIGAPYLAGLAGWWEIAAILAGLVLIAFELFVLPGLGVAGILGVVSLLGGLVGTFVAGDVSTTTGRDQLVTGSLTVLIAAFTAGIGMWLIGRQLNAIPVLNRIILRSELGRESSTLARKSLLEAMGPAEDGLSVGVEGVAHTDLRPAGRAMFEGRIVDVQSVGSFIERGTPVRIIKVGRYVIDVEESNA